MRGLPQIILLALCLTFAVPPGARADLIAETVVSITCTTPGVPPRKGSGVVVAENGTILTAKHVVFGSSAPGSVMPVCTGSTGKATFAQDSLILRRTSQDYDAVLLKSPHEGVPFQRYCKLAPWMLRAQVIATGFPLGSKTGVPSSRVGVLSTVEVDHEGIVETDAATTSGISGGMVTMAGNGNLVGIVSGYNPDQQDGLPANYRVLAAEALAGDFPELQEDQEGCAEKAAATGILGSRGTGNLWRSVDAPLKLGMRAEEGVCFLVTVWGAFDSSSDSVGIEVIDGEYLLSGKNGGGNYHGALARCMRF